MALRESWCRGACSSRIGIAAGARSGGAACHAEQNRGTEQEEAKLGGGPPPGGFAQQVDFRVSL
jgi:hypothetical protein